MPKVGYTCGSQHVPRRVGIHVLATGAQRTHKKRAFKSMARFIEMMMAHRSQRQRPVISRSRVSAKAVLLHTAARMDSVPVMFPARPMKAKLAGGTSPTWRPTPWATLRVAKTTERRRQIWVQGG